MTVRGPTQVHVAKPTSSNAKPIAKPIATPPQNRPTLPVTATDKPVDRKFASVTLHPAGHDSPALRLDDIVAAPEQRRDLLLWRFVGNASLRAGLALGATQTELPASSTVKRGDVRLATSDGRTLAVTIGSETRTIDAQHPKQDDMMFALRAFDRTLLKKGAADVDVAKLYLPLFGPDGSFVRGKSKSIADTFEKPHLFCFDFNGTVERFDDGRTRGELPGSTSALRRRGGVSVLTTTARAESGEQFLEKHRVPFVAHYGEKQIRPTSGNKEYAAVARAHGIELDDAKHVMATFGDSKTDAPGDLPGVVFFHNDADTPAPALERVLSELDERGHGSLHDGLAALVHGWPTDGAKKHATLGSISFDVEVRDATPTIFNVKLHYSTNDLVAALKKMPPASKLDERASYKLALEHLADTFPWKEIPAVLDGLGGAPGLRAAQAAVKRRLEWREHQLVTAREFLAKSDAWSKKALSSSDAIRRLHSLVELGDAEISARAKSLAQQLVDVGPAAEQELLQSIAAHARHLKAHLKKAGKAALPLGPGGSSGDVAALEKIARDPVPFDADRQQKQLDAVDAVIANPPAGSAPILNRILSSLEESLPKEKKVIRDKFADRAKSAAQILAAVDHAESIAKARPKELAAIAKALSATASP